MKYPYIGEGVNSGSVVILYSKGFGVTIDSKSWATDSGSVEYTLNELFFKNITREYLDGKCVKIESPEHSEFVQKLAFNAGFSWSVNGVRVHHKLSKLLSFHSSGEITHKESEGGSCFDYEEITIPLPPKATTKSDEWPQVGMKFQHKESKKQGEIIALHKGVALVEYPCMKPISVDVESMEKPKTEAEILRDELIELTLNHMENKSHPIEANAYYLVSVLIDKYITKKPQ